MKKTFVGSILLIFSLTFVFAFQNCGKDGGSGIAPSTDDGDDDDDVQSNGKVLVDMQFKVSSGGVVSADKLIQFIHSARAYLKETAATGDCPVRARLSDVQIAAIIQSIKGLSYQKKPAGSPVVAPEAYVEFTYKGVSEKLRLYLKGAPVGGNEVIKGQNDFYDALVDLINNENYSGGCADDFDWTKAKSVRFFEGGWFGPAGSPNWKTDYTLVFASSGVHIERKKLTGGCEWASTTQEKLNELLSRLKSQEIRTKGAGEPQRADGGSATVNIEYKDGKKHTIFVDGGPEASVGAYVYISPYDALKAALDNLPGAKINGTCAP